MRFVATYSNSIRRTLAASCRSALALAACLLAAASPGAAQRVDISGRIVRPVAGDTLGLPGARVLLHRIGQDRQGAIDSTPTARDGAFRFRAPHDTSAIFLVSARYGGVEFFSPPFTFDSAAAVGPVVLVVSDTSSTAPVHMGARYLVVGAPDAERARTVVDLIVLRNLTDTTRVAPDSLTPTWRGVLPRASAHVVAEAGSELSASAVRFKGDTVLVFAPLAPGDKQLLLQYTLPAAWTEWDIPMGEGVSTLQIVSEAEGVFATGEKLKAVEAQVMDGRALARWAGEARAGSVVRVTFPSPRGDERTAVRVLVVLMGLALVAFAWLGIRRSRARAGAAMVFLLAIIAGCQSSQPAAVIRVVDDLGDTVTLAQPATRVVSLVPAATEVLFAIGAGATLVGRTDWCDYPAEALRVPSLGGGLDPSVEAVAAAHPDLVVLYPSPQTTAAAARLRSLGVPTLQLRTDGLADLARTVRLLGTLTSRSVEAEAVVARMDSSVSAATRPAAARPTVLILAWDQPPTAIGAPSFLHEVVTRAGGTNLFADLAVPSAPVSLEAIAARDPDLVLVTAPEPRMAARPEWQVVRAVRDRRFVVAQGTEFLRPTPRAGAAIAQLARLIDSVGRP